VVGTNRMFRPREIGENWNQGKGVEPTEVEKSSVQE